MISLIYNLQKAGIKMQHKFKGVWITDEEFFDLKPRNVFHKQLEPLDLPCDQHRNRHILFRKTFMCSPNDANATVYISADDYYKLYINGRFVGQGPAPSYHSCYNYNKIDVRNYLQEGENVIAVHTLYQGLINRVWQSGDNRHGLIMDLEINGKTIVSTDESFKTAPHTAYTETGVCGASTQFLEQYDSNAPEVGFTSMDFDDSSWNNAKRHLHADHVLTPQQSYMLEFETITPVSTRVDGARCIYDFGSNYVGYLRLTAHGPQGATVTVRCGQELNPDGSVRYQLRAKCVYEENWILAQGESTLDWFDYKSFRYAEIQLPQGVEITDVYIEARRYPFRLQNTLKASYAGNPQLQKIWELCVHTQKYGVQEVIQDCMDREKGFYLGDGCYTALTNMILTGDDSMVRKLIDDAFSTTFISDTLVTCMCCSFMQEIAEYPLILVYLVLWHYNYTGDKEYLTQNYAKVLALLEAYRHNYEKDGLLREVDKWCVVEWPINFQQEYDVDIRQGKVCTDAHISLNAYYIAAVRVANAMANVLSLPAYRDEMPLISSFMEAFYDEEKHLFTDGENTNHITLVGNSFVYGFGICTKEEFQTAFFELYRKNGISSLSFFCTFPLLIGFAVNGKEELLLQALLDKGTWRRMLREDATTTFEGWGKDTKANASLFHLTMSYAAAFMAEIDLKKLFEGF